MFRHILVPLDGSFTAERVLPWMQDYAFRAGGQITVLRVIPSREIPGDEHDAGRVRDDAHRYVDGIARQLRDHGVQAAGRVRSGSPPQVIAETAQDLGAHLIAMNSRGATTFHRALFGGTAEKVLRLTTKPIFLMHAATEPPKEFPIRCRVLLVPLDGSALSESILPHAHDLARFYGSTLHLLHVGGGDRSYRVKDRLREITEMIARRRMKVEFEVVAGDAVEKILEAVGKRGVDMMAMNSNGRSGFQKLFLGSVAEEVIHATRIPTLLTRARRPALFRLAEPVTGAAHRRPSA